MTEKQKKVMTEEERIKRYTYGKRQSVERINLVVAVDLLGVLANQDAFPNTLAFNYDNETAKIEKEWEGANGRHVGTPKQIRRQAGARHMDIVMRELSNPKNGILNKDIFYSLEHLKQRGEILNRRVGIAVVTRLPQEVVPDFFIKYNELETLIDGYSGSDSVYRASSLEPILRGLRDDCSIRPNVSLAMPHVCISSDPEEISAFRKENIHKLIYYGGNCSEAERAMNIAAVNEIKAKAAGEIGNFDWIEVTTEIHGLERALYKMVFNE